MLEPSFVLMKVVEAITDGILETGALGVLRKSQNPTVLGQDGSSSTQCSHASWECHWHQWHAQLV